MGNIREVRNVHKALKRFYVKEIIKSHNKVVYMIQNNIVAIEMVSTLRILQCVLFL